LVRQSQVNYNLFFITPIGLSSQHVQVFKCSSVDTEAAAALRYAIYGTESDGYYYGLSHKRVYSTTIYLWKSVILECIQIPHFS